MDFLEDEYGAILPGKMAAWLFKLNHTFQVEAQILKKQQKSYIKDEAPGSLSSSPQVY